MYKSAAETLVHYIKLALARDLSRDSEEELAGIIQTFSALDDELRFLRNRQSP